MQETESDIRFIDRVFSKERGRPPLTLREDFCGTAKLCADWVRSRAGRSSIGLDLHKPTLAWADLHNIEPLGDDRRRVDLCCRNVMDGTRRKMDVTVAFNFSYCVFKERSELLAYCRRVRTDLNRDGAFLLDIHGGTEAYVEMEETQRRKGFTYVWDQRPYDAVNGLGVRYIHFRFPDGSQIKRAFTYDWRIWTLPELKDVLSEAGFARVDVYWEGADEDGGGNGIFRKVKKAINEESWIAYVVGWKR